jgi:hypothetical protein
VPIFQTYRKTWAAIRKRATAAGFTIYLENDGRFEHASRWLDMNLREQPSFMTTKDEITLGEVEQIRL